MHNCTCFSVIYTLNHGLSNRLKAFVFAFENQTKIETKREKSEETSMLIRLDTCGKCKFYT